MIDPDELTDADVQRMRTKIDEIYRLYNISEAEQHLVMQMTVLVKLMGLSRKLTNKILKACSAIEEMMVEEETIIRGRGE